MKDSREKELQALIQTALTKAKETDGKVTCSYVEQTERLPLEIYLATEQSHRGKRFIWRNPDKTLSFVGIGIAEKFAKPSENRFAHVENVWKQLVENNITRGIQSQQGTGLLCFGGFTFNDEQVQNESLWQSFAPCLFQVPKYLFTANSNGLFLTSTLSVDSTTTEDQVKAFLDERVTLMNTTTIAEEESSPVMNSLNEGAPDKWQIAVADVIKRIRDSASDHVPKAEKVKKVVLARTLELTFQTDIPPSFVVQALDKQQMNSYVLCLESEQGSFVCATPERLVRKDGKTIYSDCVAGTAVNGSSPIDDKKIGEVLLHDEKNVKEHQFVVDYICAKVMDMCSEMHIPAEPQVLMNRHVQHLHTPIEGTVQPGFTLFDFVKELHPTPALGGTPLQNALKIIREVETVDRGLYASPIGWIDRNGDGEFVVGIRSGLIQGKKLTLFAGGGVVAGSKPEAEYLETVAKFRPMLAAMGALTVIK